MRKLMKSAGRIIGLMMLVALIVLGLPSALSANKDVPRMDGVIQDVPVEDNVHIYKGAQVCANISGFAVPAADTNGYRYAGIAFEECDNTATGHSQGGKSVRVYKDGRFKLTATSITQAMVGQMMYVVDDATVDETSSNYICAGRLVGYVSSTVGWIDISQGVKYGMTVDATSIYVSTKGNDTVGDGSLNNPVATVTKALTLVSATRKTIFVAAGDYAEAAILTWPNINGVRIIGTEGQGNIVISNANAAASVIIISPTYTAESFEAFIQNVNIKHAAQVGIQINNTNMSKKLIIQLKNVSTEQVSTGDSIDVLHAAAGQAIRIYASGCDEIEGLVDIDCANADDRFRFYDCTLIGGLTEVGAVAGELTLKGCIVLTSGLAYDATMVVSIFASAYRTDAGVYSTLAESLNG